MHPLRLAWVHVRAQLGQLVAAVVVIALGVGLAGALLLANEALLESARASTEALAGRADVHVRTVSGGALDEGLVERVRGVDAVEAAAPLVLGTVSFPGATGNRLAVVGVDLLDDATVRLYRSEDAGTDIDDPLVVLNQPDSVLTPQAFAAARGLERGDSIEVDAPSGRRRLVVRGLIRGVDLVRAFGGEFLVLDLYAAQELLAMPGGLSQIDVVLRPGIEPAAAIAALRTALPPHVVAELVEQRRSAFEQTVAGLGMGMSRPLLIFG